MRTIRGELHVRNLESGSETIVEARPCAQPGVSHDLAERSADRLQRAGARPAACNALSFIASLVDGESRLVRDDCGGRPRQWLDEQTLLVETFGSGLNSFFLIDTRDGSQRPLLSAAKREGVESTDLT